MTFCMKEIKFNNIKIREKERTAIQLSLDFTKRWLSIQRNLLANEFCDISKNRRVEIYRRWPCDFCGT